MLSEKEILSAKILAIDDNVLNLQILKKILSSAGFTKITISTDPLKAEQLYQEISPDLFLLDLNMSPLSGFELMRQLRTEYPDDYLPILVLTAEDEQEALKALSAGAKDVLSKPYKNSELLLRCRNIIEVRLLYKQMKKRSQ